MSRPVVDLFGDVAPAGFVRGAVDPFGEVPPAVRPGQAPPDSDAVDPFGGEPPVVWSQKPRHTPEALRGVTHQTRPRLTADAGPFGRMMAGMSGRRANVDDGMSRAKSANVMALAKHYGIDPTEAAEHYDALTEGMKDQPTPGAIAVGAGEAGLHVVTGIPAALAGGAAAVRPLAAGQTDKVRPVFDAVAGALTYEPKTAMGRNLSEAAMAPLGALHEAAPVAGDWVFDQTGSPVLAGLAATAVEAAPLLLMARGPLRAVSKAITESAPWRMATIKERGLVVQSLEATLEKNPGLTEAQLVKMSDRYFAEALARRKQGEGPGGDGTAQPRVDKADAVDPLAGGVKQNVRENVANMEAVDPRAARDLTNEGGVLSGVGARRAVPVQGAASGVADVYALDHNLPTGTVAGGVDEIVDLHDRVVAGGEKGARTAVRFGVVTPIDAAALKASTGLDLDSYKHVVDNSGVNHIYKRHGAETQADGQGHLPVDRSDFERLPDIVENYDSVERVETGKPGPDLIRYVKRYDDRVYVVEEIRKRRRELMLKTMWKIRGAGRMLPGEQAPGPLRPERVARPLPHDENSITPDSSGVKPAQAGPRQSTAGQNIRTLRGAIRAKGGIDFLNFSGELRDMHLDVKYLSRRGGRPVDTLETELKSEGWLMPDESLLDVLRHDHTVLRRGPVGRDVFDKPEHEFTPREQTLKKEMAREPEEPPAGDYKTVDAQDLPVGEELTIIDGKGKDGWDTYKVIEKDPFGVTLKDGVTVHLRPDDPVSVNVSGIEGKLGEDGYFNGQDVHLDADGTVKTYPKNTGAPSGFGSTGGHAEIPIVMEMPEIVELAQGIMDGAYPAVRRKLRGLAIGRFRHRGKGPGASGQIEIEAGLFKNLDEAKKVLAHEIGHAVDWVPDKDMARGNILGRLASLKKYMKHQIEEAPGVGGPHISPKERAALKAEARRMLEADAEGVIDAEISRTMPVTPADVLSIFNSVETLPGVSKALLDHVKGMSTAQKKAVVKAAMKGLVPDELQRFAKVVKEGGLGKAPGRKATDAEVMARFNELFLNELKKRRLIHLSTVVDELKSVTMKWRPFDEAVSERYTKYRYSGAELYADAFSAFVTNPGWLKQEAPVWFDAFVRYMENKPEVKRVWDEIQETMRYGSEALSRHRRENIDDMFKQGHQARRAMAEKNKPRVRSVVDALMTGLVDKHYSALKEIRKLEKRNTPAGKRARLLRYTLEELPYIASEADVYMKRFYDQVMAALEHHGIPADDFGFYLFERRVLGDRAELANPLGHSPENVRVDLAHTIAEWGPEKTAVVEQAREAFRALREDKVFPLMRESGLFSKDLMDTIEGTEDYAKFSVIHYLEKEFGSGTAGRVFRQIGTLAKIENPVVPTVLQDLSVIRAARMNIAKRDLIGVLSDLGVAAPAELRYSLDAKGMRPVEPKDSWMRLMTVMVDGKPRHYVVDKAIAEMFEYAPVESNAMVAVIKFFSQPIREILVSKNPVWMSRNVVRDFLTTAKNVPEVRLQDMPKLAGYYRAAWGEVWREVFKGERSSDIEELMELKALPKERHWSEWDEAMDTELDRLAADFDVNPAANRAAPGAVSKLKTVWATLDRLGRVSEVWGKLAGFKYMKEQTGRDIREIAHVVRSRVGTPDIKRRGAWNVATNNIYMFSNVGKEGLRAAWESARERPGAYLWKTLWVNVMPRMMVWGLGSGVIYKLLSELIGPDDEDVAVAQAAKRVQRIIAGISEYDRSMYTCIPMYLRADGKSVYLRIPNDYEGQFFGALAHKLLVSRKFTGHGGVVNLVAEQIPYSFNPLITALGNLWTYTVKGQNPVDDYRGQTVMPDVVYRAGGVDAHVAMAKSTWKDLGGSVLYVPAYDDLETDKGAWEGFLSSFPGNVLGAYVRIGDQGIRERIERDLDAIDKRKAKESLVRRQGLIRVMNGQDMSLEQVNEVLKMSGGALKRQLKGFLARTCGDAYLAAWLRAVSDEERMAVLSVMVEDSYIRVDAEAD